MRAVVFGVASHMRWGRGCGSDGLRERRCGRDGVGGTVWEGRLHWRCGRSNLSFRRKAAIARCGVEQSGSSSGS